jgi:predicted Zn-dependent protease
MADAMFGRFLNETPADRERLDDVSISTRQERAIGDAGVKQLLASLKQQGIRVLERGRDVEYLESLAAAIRPQMKNVKRYPNLRVLVAETEQIDARAFPGGTIVCSTGFIEFADSEAALVGVLAHELSHIDRGHQLRLEKTAALAERSFTPGRAPAATSPQDMMFLAKQFARPFRADDEGDADQDSATWTFHLGYDPLEMANLLRRLAQRQPPGPVKMPTFLRTHPYPTDRDAAIRELAAQLQSQRPNDALYVGRKNLQSRVPRSARQFDE